MQEFEVPRDEDNDPEDDDYIDEEDASGDIAGSANVTKKRSGKEDLITTKRWVVIVKDFSAFLKKIMEERKIPWHQSMSMKIGIDGGQVRPNLLESVVKFFTYFSYVILQGFLKVCLCLYQDDSLDDFVLPKHKSPEKKKPAWDKRSELGQKMLMVLFMGEKVGTYYLHKS